MKFVVERNCNSNFCQNLSDFGVCSEKKTKIFLPDNSLKFSRIVTDGKFALECVSNDYIP